MHHTPMTLLFTTHVSTYFLHTATATLLTNKLGTFLIFDGLVSSIKM